MLQMLLAKGGPALLLEWNPSILNITGQTEGLTFGGCPAPRVRTVTLHHLPRLVTIGPTVREMLRGPYSVAGTVLGSGKRRKEGTLP